MPFEYIGSSRLEKWLVSSYGFGVSPELIESKDPEFEII